jgi:hypothetical protein
MPHSSSLDGAWVYLQESGRCYNLRIGPVSDDKSDTNFGAGFLRRLLLSGAIRASHFPNRTNRSLRLSPTRELRGAGA